MITDVAIRFGRRMVNLTSRSFCLSEFSLVLAMFAQSRQRVRCRTAVRAVTTSSARTEHGLRTLEPAPDAAVVRERQDLCHRPYVDGLLPCVVEPPRARCTYSRGRCAGQAETKLRKSILFLVVDVERATLGAYKWISAA